VGANVLALAYCTKPDPTAGTSTLRRRGVCRLVPLDARRSRSWASPGPTRRLPERSPPASSDRHGHGDRRAGPRAGRV